MLRTTSRLALAAAAIVAATVIAACGSNSPHSSSSSRSGGRLTYAQAQQDAVNFAGCMRSHGVPDLPDPTTSPHDFKASLDPNSPQAQSPAFHSAVTACQHFVPRGRQPNQSATRSPAQVAAMLAFARCIRSHGFPNFPDPTSGGNVTHEMLANAGISLQQPAVLRAGDTCVSVTHGLLTKAAVARFVAGP
jgi:hypothetical protein